MCAYDPSQTLQWLESHVSHAGNGELLRIGEPSIGGCYGALEINESVDSGHLNGGNDGSGCGMPMMIDPDVSQLIPNFPPAIAVQTNFQNLSLEALGNSCCPSSLGTWNYQTQVNGPNTYYTGPQVAPGGNANNNLNINITQENDEYPLPTLNHYYPPMSNDGVHAESSALNFTYFEPSPPAFVNMNQSIFTSPTSLVEQQQQQNSGGDAWFGSQTNVLTSELPSLFLNQGNSNEYQEQGCGMMDVDFSNNVFELKT